MARVRSLRPCLEVRCGFLGLAAPGLAEVLARTAGRAVVVPLLLGTGYHVRVDIPAAVGAAGHLRTRTAGPLGPHPLLAEALGDRLGEAGWTGAPGGAVVLAAAGSRDPAAGAATGRMARMLAARLGAPVEPAFVGGASPTPAAAVAALRARGHGRVAVVPYLLAPGDFARRAAQPCGADVVGAPLGPHDAVARLVLRRYDEEAARVPVPECVAAGAGGGWG
ncbi:hypothetical protein BLA24_04695 [Streptomyces cinnamoneus]|uniref:Uncharacterized protein n=2 Tax=Streptomyces cinnamoneus TaxID=53446 RepID=A0A2G1XP05_STRCJ|nr:hypothetical protein BLA24_04695 [Streptomyces cinnamoneus]PPT11518.1 sirohydrochlorin chelatase [Streptomyces cinnamoneus]